MPPADAAATADQLLDITEGELGLLVRKGPGELGFLHRILQEQLAAEYISDRINPDDMNVLFDSHVGDPRWREVLLATMWRLRRPSELSGLMDVIRKRIDDTPAGLRAREILAEVTFGPYGLSAADIQQCAPELIDVIETHPYGPHRGRLLDSVLTGVDGAATGDIVRQCLERWTLLVRPPSDRLVREIAQLPPVKSLSGTICKLLLLALRSPNSWIAYESASAIAGRCSRDGVGSDEERGLLRTGVLNVLADPPSGLAQAAALVTLALQWRDDPLVVDILTEARTHAVASVRIVALSDALGVLRPTFSIAPAESPRDAQQLSAAEREWLLGNIKTRVDTDMHDGLVVAAVSEASRGQYAVLEDFVESLKSTSSSYHQSEMLWNVALNVLADDDRVVEIVCDQLRSEEHPRIMLRLNPGGEQLLASAYPPESPQNHLVAAAVEDRLHKVELSTGDHDLFVLAAIDRGPVMKGALLKDLETSPRPHWAAEALAAYFGDHVDARSALHSVLMGDPVRASMIANVATKILNPSEVVPRLLEIISSLARSTDPTQGRYDIVSSSLAQTCQEQGIDSGSELESIASEALSFMPATPSPRRGDPRHDLAIAFYPTTASKMVLAELEEVEDPPLELYLSAFRHDPEQVKPFLEGASKVMRSLPAYLRASVCQSLADRAVSPDLVLRLTRRWADEESRTNKSIASLAFHRALLRAKEEGHIDDEQWRLALGHLGEQALPHGWEAEAQRRGVWVGMCVCRDWSILKGREETMGEASPVGVDLNDIIYGPDRALLQQIALCWEDLRSEFGETLLTRLSGIRDRHSRNDVWNSLAFVANQNVTLEQELENAVSDDPSLLMRNGVLVWFVTRGSTNADAVADALFSHLQVAGSNGDNLVSILVAESERIGLDLAELRGRLENALRGDPVYSDDPADDPALEALAVLFPEHIVVRKAWHEISTHLGAQEDSSSRGVRAQPYFAVAYAATDQSEVLKQIESDLYELAEIGHTYFDNMFTRHVTHRLRRDPAAASMVREAILSPVTSDARAAQLVSLLAEAVGLDEDLLVEVERRIAGQSDVTLAPAVRDHPASATLSVRTILTRVADASLDVRST